MFKYIMPYIKNKVNYMHIAPYIALYNLTTNIQAVY